MPYAHQVLEHCNLDVRRVYYPGAGRDHGPFHLFGRLPTVTTVLYSDYRVPPERARRVFRRHERWRVLRERALSPAALGVEGWGACWYDHPRATRHGHPDDAHGLQARVHRWPVPTRPRRGPDALGSRAMAHVMGDREAAEEDPRDRRWVDLRGQQTGEGRPWLDLLDPAREAALGLDEFDAVYLGTEGIGTYERLLEAGFVPDAVVLQDHGFGANWSSFGGTREMFHAARHRDAWPRVLLVGAQTSHWNGYVPITDPRPYAGNVFNLARALFVREDLAADVRARAADLPRR